MDWTKLLNDLIEAKWTQERIATHCGVAQSTVSGLMRGESKNPSFGFGSSLVALHKQVCGKRPRERATA